MDLIADAPLRTIVALTTAHLVADFALQSNWMVRHKRKPAVFVAHIAIVTGVAALTLAWLPLTLLAVLAVTHAAADALKLHVLKPGAAAFLIDQSIHFAVIVALACAYPDAFDRGLWSLAPPNLATSFVLLLLILGAILASVTMGGLLIGEVLATIATPEIGQIGGLQQGGRYIGWLERALTLLFVAIGEPSGVGLLLAAKSILRFRDINDSHDRARAEYIMIGTFLSVGWALAVAVPARIVGARLLG